MNTQVQNCIRTAIWKDLGAAPMRVVPGNIGELINPPIANISVGVASLAESNSSDTIVSSTQFNVVVDSLRAEIAQLRNNAAAQAASLVQSIAQLFLEVQQIRDM